MFSCCKAQPRAIGRKTANALPIYDSAHKAHRLNHCSPLSTSSHRCASGIEPTRNGRRSIAKERQRAERDQLTRFLKESPVKRDARNFLKHFDTPKPEPTGATKVKQLAKEAAERAHHDEWRLTRTGVNLGNLYEPTKAVQDSPVFTLQELPDKARKEEPEVLHLALVKLRQPQALDDETLRGIALTLSQMARLGLNIAVVLDCDENGALDNVELDPAWEAIVREQGPRVVTALEDFNEPGAFEVGHALYRSNIETGAPSPVEARGGLEVKNNYLLLPPIEDGIIPVIPPFAYDSELKKVRVQADDILLALTREFAGVTNAAQVPNPQEHDDDALHKEHKTSTQNIVLDRIIILDPLGGIPSKHRIDGAHVFINLEAEFNDVRNDLEHFSSKHSSNHFPFSRHVKNLDVVHHALSLLPPSSSALIITPDEAAISSQISSRDALSTGVRTRRSKNPLIHNLLTDKPMISSSLPAPLVNRPIASAAPNPATFLKKGIPVTMIPDPRTTGPWRIPSPSNPSIDLENDPRIDFPRLVHLIEDSFRRKLDARHYLNRIRGRIAGIIIAGEYEGGAICTWETPPLSSTTTTSAISASPESSLWVPYLDKFAVLTSSQGSGGVADIVWGALTRSAFPGGVVWRSRRNNPVNKWYFERSVGMWNLSDGYWSMFWTTEGVVEEWARKKAAAVNSTENDGEVEGNGTMTRWDAYVNVCGSVKPSWSDGKKPD